MNRIIWTITELLSSPLMVLGYIWEACENSFKAGQAINQKQWDKYGK